MNQPTHTSRGKHLWEYQPVRDGFWCLLVLLVAWAGYTARAVTLPVVLSLAGAYAVNPLVAWFDRRWGVRRWVGSSALVAGGMLVFSGLLVYVVPKLLLQAVTLAGKLPDYLNYISDWLRIDWHTLANQAGQAIANPDQAGQPGRLSTLASNFDIRSALEFAGRSLGVGIDLVGSAIGWMTYLVVAVVVFCFCFVCFSTQFAHITTWFGTFIPADHRAPVTHTLARMDRAVSAFLRGRLIQAVVMAGLLTTGWWMAGVPYWLLLGLAAGVLSFVPYAASVGWVLALLVTWIDSVSGGTGFSVWVVIIWPTAVYGVAQLIDGWVVEPLVQGKATDLDPLTVLLAVLIGGSLGGLIGLVLAIPAAACGKILAQEWLLPRLRESGKCTSTP